MKSAKKTVSDFKMSCSGGSNIASQGLWRPKLGDSVILIKQQADKGLIALYKKKARKPRGQGPTLPTPYDPGPAGPGETGGNQAGSGLAPGLPGETGGNQAGSGLAPGPPSPPTTPTTPQAKPSQ